MDVDQRALDALVSIDATSKPFKASFAGGGSDYYEFLYSDRDTVFFFSTNHDVAETVIIKFMRAHRDSGPFINIPCELRPEIENNIFHLFTKKVFYDPAREVAEGYKDPVPLNIKFQWGQP